MQNGPDDEYLLASCCCKHYAAYDLEKLANGTDRTQFNAIVNVRNMWETYLPVFKACVVEAQSSSVMCSYNSINGVPTCGDKLLLNDILREQWGWDGFVVSDYDAVANIYDTHHYVNSEFEAAILAMNSGCDQEGGGDINSKLNLAVAQGLVSEDRINQAFKRLFRIRIRLGMLDPPTMVGYNFLNNGTDDVESPQHTRLARDVARESICLYKNNKETLPLDITKIRSIAVIGPGAPQEMLLLGNYNGYPTKIVSVLEGISEAMNFTSSLTNGDCTFEQNVDYFVPNSMADAFVNSPQECCDACTKSFGCKYFTYYQQECYFKYSEYGKISSKGRVSGKCRKNFSPNVNFALGCPTISCNDDSMFEDAVAAVKKSDVVIVVLGLSQDIEAEGLDRISLDLPGYQPELLKTLHDAAAGKPIIGVLIHGGSLTLKELPGYLDALIDAWYPGMQGGNAVADVIFGYYNPAGRTAVTWYNNISQLPNPANMDLYYENGRTYRYFNGNVTYPFGYGLSYTTFQYSNLVISPKTTTACARINVAVSVTNNGNYDGDEVVQLYLQISGNTVPAPNIRLVGFERVHIRVGESTTINFIVEPEWHSVIYDGDDIYHGQVMVEKGVLTFSVGGGQPSYFSGSLSGKVTITNTVPLSSC